MAEANEKAIDPDKVAEAVEHALTSKRPKARYLIGIDAKVQAKLALIPRPCPRVRALQAARDLHQERRQTPPRQLLTSSKSGTCDLTVLR